MSALDIVCIVALAFLAGVVVGTPKHYPKRIG